MKIRIGIKTRAIVATMITIAIENTRMFFRMSMAKYTIRNGGGGLPVQILQVDFIESWRLLWCGSASAWLLNRKEKKRKHTQYLSYTKCERCGGFCNVYVANFTPK